MDKLPFSAGLATSLAMGAASAQAPFLPASHDPAKVEARCEGPRGLVVRFVGAGTDPVAEACTVGFSATGKLSRSASGVKTCCPLIGDRVTLTISGAFHRQG